MSCSLYHLLLATLAAAACSGCTTSGSAMNWGPFQRRTETADTIPLNEGQPATTQTVKQPAPKQQMPKQQAPKQVTKQQPPKPETESSWSSWNPFASSPKETKQPQASAKTGAGKIDANPDLKNYQGSVGSRLAKGRELERAGQLERARTIYEELIRQYPQSAEPYHRLGVVADKQHRYREAQELLIQSLQIDPMNADVRVDLGYCFYMQGQLAQAEAETREALKVDPRSERAHNNLGLVLGAQDRMAEALEHFRRGGSEADAQFNLAFVFASRNKLPAAKECFQRALDIDPNHEKARKALDSFETYENQPDEIRQAMELAFETERRGTIPFVEAGTVMKASAEGDASPSASGPNSVVPAIGGRAGSGPVTPRNASKAIHGLYNDARSQKGLNSQGE